MKSFYQIGCKVSAVVADIAAHPFAQLAVIAACTAWFVIGFETDLLTAALSILAITLTQMVLNRQNEREIDAHRRDLALHAKLDELLVASKRARNEVAGLEEKSEEAIELERKRIAEEAEAVAEEAEAVAEDAEAVAEEIRETGR